MACAALLIPMLCACGSGTTASSKKPPATSSNAPKQAALTQAQAHDVRTLYLDFIVLQEDTQGLPKMLASSPKDLKAAQSALAAADEDGSAKAPGFAHFAALTKDYNVFLKAFAAVLASQNATPKSTVAKALTNAELQVSGDFSNFNYSLYSDG